MEVNLNFVLQIVSIIAGVFGIVVAVVNLFRSGSVGNVVVNIFAIFFSLLIVTVEVYVFDAFKYIAFLLTFWGKGIMYLFMGFLLFNSWDTLSAIGGAFFWVLFILYVIVFFITKSSSPPLMQKGSPPNFETSEADYYKGDGAPKNTA